MLSFGSVYAQEVSINTITNNLTIQSGEFMYSFSIQDINDLSPDADIKTIQAVCKPIFEAHPKFHNGVFRISTNFAVSLDRIEQILLENGFTISDIRVINSKPVHTIDE